MDSQSRSFVSHKCFWVFAGVVIAFCLGATPFAAAAVAPDADRTFSHPSEDNQTKYLTLAPDTYTFRTDANPNGYHWVEWYDTYSGGSPVATAHFYYYDDTNFNLATSGWVRAEVYKSDFWGNWLGWEAAYRWYVTVIQPKPDLIVQDISISPSSPVAGQSITITATLKNQGNADCGRFYLKYYIDGVNIGQDDCYWGLNAGDSDTESISYTVDSGGNHTVKVFVDSNYDIDESLEGNNTREETYYWSYPPETISPPTSILGNQATYTNTSNSYTASGASSNLGHSIEYRFKWDDGTYSSWGSATRSHSWSTAGDYYIDAQARCATHTDKVSSWGNISWNVKVLNPPQITVTSPNGGESWQAGTEKTITWNSTETVGANVRIELYKDDSYFGYIVTSTANDGAYTWPIPSNLQAGTTYQVKIIDTSNSSVYDYSNGYFYVTAPPPVDNAAILDFDPPTGILQRGTQTTATVRVKNTGTTTRSFWIGLSFAHETATNAGWPYGWYDIYPIQTNPLQPNEEQLITFDFTIPETLQAGQYYATAAIWEGFDVSRHQMSGQRFDDTRNYSVWSDVETGDTSFSLQPFALSQDNQTIVDQLKYILGLSQFIGTLEDSYRMGDDAEKPLLAIGASIPASIAGVPVSVGGSVLIDLADLCEVTPEGKEGWVTVWIAGEEGMTIGISLLPMGVIRQDFSFRERGFADYRSSILAVGEVSVPGLTFTSAYYDEYDGWHGPAWEWNGQLAISLSVLNGKFGSLVSREIDRQMILDALVNAATPGMDLDSYVINLVDLLAAIPSSGYRDLTYDDGDWKINPSQWEANLKMRKLWDNPFDFSHYFYVDVPENTSELNIVTNSGTGNANLHIRYGQRPDGLYHEGEYTYGSNNPDNEESITISNPPSGKFYLMLAAITEYDGVNLVANLTTATPILGDITGDGKVDFADLARLANEWLWTGQPGSISEDILQDGIINFADFALLAQNWLAGL